MIVDAHCHLFPKSFSERHNQLVAQDVTFASLFPQPGARIAEVEDLVKAMNRSEVGLPAVPAAGSGEGEPGVAAHLHRPQPAEALPLRGREAWQGHGHRTRRKQQGFDRSVVMGFGWCDPEIAREANDYVIQAAAKYPERLTGFCSVNRVLLGQPGVGRRRPGRG